MTEAELASYPVDDPRSPVDWSEGGTVLAFLNEVAGGRKLLEAIRERVDAGADAVAVAAPQNQPIVGQIVDRDEVRDAAQSRVEVTQVGARRVRDRGRGRGHRPGPARWRSTTRCAPSRRSEVLLSCLYETPLRAPAPRPGRVGQGSLRGPGDPHPGPRRRRRRALGRHPHARRRHPDDQQPGPDRRGSRRRAAETPHRYTIICPRSGDLAARRSVERLARTLAELYRAEIDATGQPMSPEPFAAIENAIEHYRIDDILISTLAGQQSKWLEEGLIEQVKEITDKPVEHFEAGARRARAA